MEQMQFDVVVIGGGHAGVEAAHIAAQFPLKVALVTMPGIPLGSAPCNPAIGGVGKGQVVREIDAMGGLMGKCADLAGIQFRTLNESKGPAVQATRVQIDKDIYPVYVERELSQLTNLTIVRQKVNYVKKSTSYRSEDPQFVVVLEKSGSIGPLFLSCKRLVVTLGTFLGGKLHRGSMQSYGGRIDAQDRDTHTARMDDFMGQIPTISKRFKTGTPARIRSSSIDFTRLEEQPSDSSVKCFHLGHSTNLRNLQQVSCYITRTNEKTIDIILKNKELSPMFNGQIQAVGARYCPSIEDKAFRYPHKSDHHIFLEPETRSNKIIYPSGISSSLPEEVQDQFLRTIVGLEECEVERYGYAVEYDVVDTSYLNQQLEHSHCCGLYFAGQVNGTSGYEEAAGQGLVAGMNCALACLGRKPSVINRLDSYIGVMIDDLVHQSRDEPYRLFTARCENRLVAREDNAFIRMYPYRKALALKCEFDNLLDDLNQQYFILNSIVDNYRRHFEDIVNRGKLSLGEYMQLHIKDTIAILQDILNQQQMVFDCRVVHAVAITKGYAGFISKASKQQEKVEELDNKKLHLSSVLSSENISFECKQRIEHIQPTTFGQLRRIPGLRSSTLAIVASQL